MKSVLLREVIIHRVCFRAKWLKEPNPEAEELFRMVAEVFIFWAKSHVNEYTHIHKCPAAKSSANIQSIIVTWNM